MIPLIAGMLSYFIGAIPFGLLVTRIAGGVDVRTVGSGNIGATNVLRAAGKKAALVTLLADCAKGLLPVLAASRFVDNAWTPAACGIAAVLGHNFPVFLGFQGGKGVATGFGVMLALTPWFGLASLLSWLASAVIWKYSSLAALVAYAAYPVMVFSLRSEDHPLQFISLFLFSMIYYRHRDNIKRLLTGDEPKIGKKK
mgnify:FL=1